MLRMLSNSTKRMPNTIEVVAELSWVMFNGHPDAISITVVLVPSIEQVAIFLDTSKGIMGKAGSHHHIFIYALKIIVVKLLHSSCSINLGVNLQHFWVCVMIVETTVSLGWTEPHIHFDVKLPDTTPWLGFSDPH